MKDTCVLDDSFARKTVPNRRCSIRKRSLTKRVRARGVKTKNGSIRRRAYLAGWFAKFKKFSQIARRGRVEAVVAQRSEFVLH